MSAGRGIAMIVVSFALFATMDTIIKWLIGEGYTVWQVGFCRGVCSLPLVWWLVQREGGLATLKTRRPILHIWRCVTGVSAMLLFFFALGGLPLADAVTLGFSQPFVITALSVPLLGEKVGRHRWAAIAVGFVGVLIVLRPGVGVLNPASLIVLASVVCSAFAIISIRQLVRTESPASIVLWFTVATSVVCGVMLLVTGGRWPGDGLELGLLVLIGVLGGFGQLASVLAYRLAAIAVLAPFQYVALPFAVVYGWFVFQVWPDAWVWVGSAVIIASGLYILWRETVRRRA